MVSLNMLDVGLVGRGRQSVSHFFLHSSFFRRSVPRLSILSLFIKFLKHLSISALPHCKTCLKHVSISTPPHCKKFLKHLSISALPHCKNSSSIKHVYPARLTPLRSGGHTVYIRDRSPFLLPKGTKSVDRRKVCERNTEP